MNIYSSFKLFLAYRRLQARNRWTRERMLQHQWKALQNLRAYAYTRSPFYQQFHRGLFEAPLPELPVLTKSALMANWDDIVTDRTVDLITVEKFLSGLKETTLFRNRYYVASTAGSTGLKGIFIYNRREWRDILLSYLRSSGWGGVKLSPFHKLRVAAVTTVTPWHQSALVADTLNNWFVPTVRIDSTESLPAIVARLNEFQPACLVAYASIARLLAQEKFAGNLNITPDHVFCTSEVLTRDSREIIERAWGISPIDVYGATETAAIASGCTREHGLHLHEDLVIPEVVDSNSQPVPPGRYSDKLLVTVLFSRTVPLIRYEISDSIRLSPDEPEDLPFALTADIQGRQEDIVYLAGRSGEKIAIAPNLFHFVMERLPVGGWQITKQPGNHLRVAIYNPQTGFREEDMAGSLREALVRVGVAAPVITVEYVTSLEKRALGKTYLIKAMGEN